MDKELTQRLFNIFRSSKSVEESAKDLFEAMPSNKGKAFSKSPDKEKYLSLVKFQRSKMPTETSSTFKEEDYTFTPPIT